MRRRCGGKCRIENLFFFANARIYIYIVVGLVGVKIQFVRKLRGGSGFGLVPIRDSHAVKKNIIFFVENAVSIRINYLYGNLLQIIGNGYSGGFGQQSSAVPKHSNIFGINGFANAQRRQIGMGYFVDTRFCYRYFVEIPTFQNGIGGVGVAFLRPLG